MTVGEEIDLEGFFRVSGTRTYPTRSGSTTAQVFERFDMDRVRPFLKKRAKEGKQRRNVSTEPEFVAAKKLRSARRAAKRYPASARRITKQIIERYPNTWAAGESKKLLSDLSN
jgi:predicted transcriptional regulator